MLEVGKQYRTRNGLLVEINNKNSIGEFMGTVHTNKKTSFGRNKKEQCGWKSDGTCVWPLFPEWNLDLKV